MAADADVPLAVVEDRGAKELVPRGRGDGEWNDDEGAHTIRTGLGDKGVEKGGRGVREESLAVKLGAVRATGKRPVRYGEGVLTSSTRLSIASDETGDKSVGLRSKGPKRR